MIRRSYIHRIMSMVGVVTLSCVAISLSSCDKVFEDLNPCPQGLRLRFVNDFNMEFANAFPSQVECLTLLVYNSDGTFCDIYHASAPEISDENWRMEIDLSPGEYNLLAYGGMDCVDASFKFVQAPAQTLMENLVVYLPSEFITSPRGTELHPLFYGALNVRVPEEDSDYTDATVNMMKDTNNLRIILQNLDGSPVDDKDFSFTVTADNTLFNYQNNIIPAGIKEFYPWASGTEIVGTSGIDDRPVQVGFAEFSLSRFMASSSARLIIKKSDDQQTVLAIPLVDYLLLLKSQQFQSMSSQEFLDRESRWSMLFFLDGGSHWISTQIIINNWIVRINNIDIFG